MALGGLAISITIRDSTLLANKKLEAPVLETREVSKVGNGVAGSALANRSIYTLHNLYIQFRLGRYFFFCFFCKLCFSWDCSNFLAVISYFTSI